MTTIDQQTKITNEKFKPNSRSKTNVSYTDNCLVSKYTTEVLCYLLIVYKNLYLINNGFFFNLNK